MPGEGNKVTGGRKYLRRRRAPVYRAERAAWRCGVGILAASRVSFRAAAAPGLRRVPLCGTTAKFSRLTWKRSESVVSLC